MAKAQTFGPYSPINRAEGFYFVSGQVGVDPQTKLAAATVAEQTGQVLENIAAVLATEGLGLKNVVKTTIFLTDVGDFAAVNEVYAKYFAEPPKPARSTVGVRELPRVGGDTPILVEIEAIAMKEKSQKV